MNEDAIAAGTRLLTAAEAAPRLGYIGKRGVERLRAEAAARVIPGIRRGRRWMFHWPTVVSALNRFAGTAKDNAEKGVHGSAGFAARVAQGGAGSTQWESPPENKRVRGVRSTTEPKRTAETIRVTRMREGSISPVLPPNFSGSTGAHRGGMRKGRAADPISADGDCLPHRP